MNFDLIAQQITPSFVIDVGARLGDFSKEAKAVWTNAEFLLVEANDECQPTLAESGFDYTIAVLSDREKEVDFYTMRNCPMATGCSYYKEKTHFFDNPVIEKRRTTTLDQVLADHLIHGGKIGIPILLKIDTQGSELDILQGSENVLKSEGLQAIVLEVCHQEYNEGATNTNEAIAKFMAEHEFYVAEKLGNICHPIERDKIIQSDVLYKRLVSYGG